ncbi:hypothetical protein QFC24_002586 [Naganishia onofrii]|uniref:Uncharacterized protein n=1 Tax=Naganishia onofrii TaxID=1851511 RepID=A0ACC2XRC4_9TREE|nr:hypothetical protein QFC24_002586 [Naganishia onofrii]
MVSPAEQTETKNPEADRMPKLPLDLLLFDVQLVCFDLDYTLWDLWIDTHVTPPLKRKGDAVNALHDRYARSLLPSAAHIATLRSLGDISELAFYREVPDVLAELQKSKIHIAAASRTHAPDLAREALRLLLIPQEKGSAKMAKAITFFETMEIYPGSKLRHFKSIHAKTGIPYSEMLFFDDEARNKEVESLGVTMHLVRNGVDRSAFSKGVAEWRKRNGR